MRRIDYWVLIGWIIGVLFSLTVWIGGIAIIIHYVVKYW